MKITAILFSLVIGILMSVSTSAQTAIVFAKGKTEKVTTITVGPKDMNTYSLNVKQGQVINVEVSGDISISKTNEFPVIGLNLSNGVEDVDKWQDGEGYLSILTGRAGKFVFSVNNSDRKRARTFQLKVSVTDDPHDYVGGTD